MLLLMLWTPWPPDDRKQPLRDGHMVALEVFSPVLMPEDRRATTARVQAILDDDFFRLVHPTASLMMKKMI